MVLRSNSLSVPKWRGFNWRAGFALAFVIVAVWQPAARAQAGFATEATSVLMIDVGTGTTLLSKNPDAPVAPASLAKLMTAERVFAALAEGRVNLGTPFKISEYAWRTGGGPSGTSAMFADLNDQVSAGNLLRGMIIQSGNDAAIAMAEGLAGSEADFVADMNKRAAELGLAGSQFANATGLPLTATPTVESAKVTMRDMVRLARHLQDAYPDKYGLFSEPDFEWNGIFQRNRNPVLSANLGVDGLQTGFTDASGYSAVISARRGNRRLVLAASGFKTIESRASGLRELIEWGFDAFVLRQIAAQDTIVGMADVFGGTAPTVTLMTAEAASVLVPVDAGERLSAQLVYRGPLRAPVVAGTQVGKLMVRLDNEVVREFPLVAGEAVVPGGMRERAMGALKELAFGWLR
ncbi:MAG: D-alanyl-D-alanine carboxypeptidase [Phyllobacteriaceae bacterium]|nr:D-alanyl-D-alanine carboxypeptidase [Phyllobacteriaceae bacterium]